MTAVPATRASFVGEASFSGCIALCARPRSEVEVWLPAGHRVEAGDCAGPATARVAFAFGTHRGSATRFAGFDLRLGIVYHELGIFVPDVARSASAERCLYVARMYSSYYPAVWNGNTHYGFAKQLVEIDRLGPIFSVRNAQRSTLLEAVSEPAGEWRAPARGSVPSLEVVRDIFAQPVLGRLADGRLVRSRFVFEFGAARVRPVDVCIEIDDAEVADEPSGSLELQKMIWRLSWPEAYR